MAVLQYLLELLESNISEENTISSRFKFFSRCTITLTVESDLKLIPSFFSTSNSRWQH